MKTFTRVGDTYQTQVDGWTVTLRSTPDRAWKWYAVKDGKGYTHDYIWWWPHHAAGDFFVWLQRLSDPVFSKAGIRKFSVAASRGGHPAATDHQ